MNEQFMTVDEVAFIMNTSSQTVRKLIKEKKLRAIKIGRIYRIPSESIEEFIRARR